LVISLSSKNIRPLRTGSMPKHALKAVDLPAPFGPMIVVIALRCTVSDSPCRIVSLP